MGNVISVKDTNDEQFALGRLPKAVGLVVRGGRAITPADEAPGDLAGTETA